MEQVFIPMLLEESSAVRIRKVPPQLPDNPETLQTSRVRQAGRLMNDNFSA